MLLRLRIFSFLLTAALISACSNSEKKESDEKESSENLPELSELEALVDSIRLNITSDSLELDSLKKSFDKQQSRFLIEEDEFNDAKFYRHKSIGKYWPRRKTFVGVYGTSSPLTVGTFTFQVNYHADNWLFVKGARVMVGDRKFSTPFVDHFDSQRKTDVNSGIYEVISFSDGEMNTFLNYLKEAPASEKVKIRSEGKEFYDEATLSSNDKKALLETYELYQTRKEIKAVSERYSVDETQLEAIEEQIEKRKALDSKS